MPVKNQQTGKYILRRCATCGRHFVVLRHSIAKLCADCRLGRIPAKPQEKTEIVRRPDGVVVEWRGQKCYGGLGLEYGKPKKEMNKWQRTKRK